MRWVLFSEKIECLLELLCDTTQLVTAANKKIGSIDRVF
jgi:hypothetical protein